MSSQSWSMRENPEKHQHTQDKPENRQAVSHAQVWLCVADYPQCRAQEDHGGYAGDNEDFEDGRFIRGVSGNVGIDRVVWMRASSRHDESVYESN